MIDNIINFLDAKRDKRKGADALHKKGAPNRHAKSVADLTFNFEEVDLSTPEEECRAWLVIGLATYGVLHKTATSQEIRDWINRPELATDDQLDDMLASIYADDISAGRPCLAALVVDKETRLPKMCFLNIILRGCKLPPTIELQRQIHEIELEAVRKYLYEFYTKIPKVMRKYFSNVILFAIRGALEKSREFH